MGLDRRTLLKLMAGSALTLSAPFSVRAASAASSEQYFVFLCADGGWDTTSLLDPKGDIRASGGGTVNRYARTAIKQVGNIRYAPWGIGNDPGTYDYFFKTYGRELLVLNGIDMETNAHPVGAAQIASGDSTRDFPCIAALLAACQNPDLPLSFITNGYYDDTAGLVPKTRASDLSTLYGLASPNRLRPSSEETYFDAEVDALLSKRQQARVLSLRDSETLPERKAQLKRLYSVRKTGTELGRILDKLPSEMSSRELERQAQIACAAFSAGVAVSANLRLGGFDTHDNNDNLVYPLYHELLSGIDFLLKEAERQGIRDKLTLVVGSDFGRRPYYNKANGRDHWPIGSMMMLGPNIRGNRVVGATSDGLLPGKINPVSLQLDDSGVVLSYRDIHLALRKLMAIHNDSLAKTYPIAGLTLPLFS